MFAKQHGISLIEVLITVLVLGIGLLGLAGLQSVSMKNTYQSAQRSQVMWLAHELVERMRANPDGTQANSYTTEVAKYSPNTKCGSATRPTPMCSTYFDKSTGSAVTPGSDCTDAQMAAFDAWELFCGYSYSNDVRTDMIDSLSQVEATISCTDVDASSTSPDSLACSPGSLISINLSWSTPDRNASTESSVAINVRL
ncbi:type IV pilus modification protein PilV [Zooshikella ganghwensis]|uniref:Type IV pilus modification protein PilV n=2 Tax=Zooshikella ganghwensis TaxID=202772 RepID=A0A4P9VPW7_9GAMM|nr:type IV pilus modification protein PilV [Zooshikella ganghwensis]